MRSSLLEHACCTGRRVEESRPGCIWRLAFEGCPDVNSAGKAAEGQFHINFHAQNGLAFRAQNGLAFRARNGLAFPAQNGLAFRAQNGLAFRVPIHFLTWSHHGKPISGTECEPILGTECEPILGTEIDTKIAPAALPIGHPLALFGSPLSQKTPRTGLVALPRRSTLVSVRRIGHAW